MVDGSWNRTLRSEEVEVCTVEALVRNGQYRIRMRLTLITILQQSRILILEEGKQAVERQELKEALVMALMEEAYMLDREVGAGMVAMPQEVTA